MHVLRWWANPLVFSCNLCARFSTTLANARIVTFVWLDLINLHKTKFILFEVKNATHSQTRGFERRRAQSERRITTNLSDKRLRCIRRSRTHTIANYREQSSASDVVQRSFERVWRPRRVFHLLTRPITLCTDHRSPRSVIESAHAHHLHVLALFPWPGTLSRHQHVHPRVCIYKLHALKGV